MATPDPARCPRCGQANDCAQVGVSVPVEHCWCFEAKIDPVLLDGLADAERDARCLCPRCAQAMALAGDHND